MLTFVNIMLPFVRTLRSPLVCISMCCSPNVSSFFKMSYCENLGSEITLIGSVFYELPSGREGDKRCIEYV